MPERGHIAGREAYPYIVLDKVITTYAVFAFNYLKKQMMSHYQRNHNQDRRVGGY